MFKLSSSLRRGVVFLLIPSNFAYAIVELQGGIGGRTGK